MTLLIHILGWLLFVLYCLGIILKLFMPLLKERKPEGPRERAWGLLITLIQTFYIAMTLFK